jgi:vesicle coat complex subunit
MDSIASFPPFKAMDANPSGTLKRFREYIDQLKLYFTLVFRKADGTAYEPSDAEKKAITIIKGGNDMKTLFEHVGEVQAADTFDAAVKKITDKLSARTNKTVQRNMLLCNNAQGGKSFEKWSQQL